jgi:DNA-binding XRE family transcriptional regulator
MGTKTFMWTARTIRNLRLAVRETQVRFAGRVGVNRSALSAWEAGKKNPSITHQATLDEIANSAGVTTRTLSRS